MSDASTARPTPIRLRGVTKTYGTGALAQTVLKGIDMEVGRGEFVMLVGPSGSGKTTLLSILGCVLSPTGGEAFLYGEPLHRLGESALPRLRRRYIGFVFQDHNLLPALSAQANVMLQLELRGLSSREARREAEEVLADVGLGDKLHALPAQLSGGQRQRVAIARALAGRPPLILADEPTASLDAQSGQRVTELLKTLARDRGHTVVVVTHDNRIFHFADRIVRIEDGLLLPDGAAGH
jgi:putative ABC transport system ATP-binding protein